MNGEVFRIQKQRSEWPEWEDLCGLCSLARDRKPRNSCLQMQGYASLFKAMQGYSSLSRKKKILYFFCHWVGQTGRGRTFASFAALRETKNHEIRVSATIRLLLFGQE